MRPQVPTTSGVDMHGYRAARVFDGERLLPGGALVLIDGERIAAVEPPGTAPPPSCPVLDLPGMTLLPGLVDAHVHLCGDSGPRALDQLPDLDDEALDAIVLQSLAAQLAAGVTTVRDLGDARWAVADRHRRGGIGPRVVASGPPVTSSGGHCAGMGGEVSGVEGMRRAVRERVDHGVDVVKVMASGGAMTPGTDLTQCQLSLAELRALVDEAHVAGLPVTAHAHAVPAVVQCLEAGVDGIEHCSCLTADGFRIPDGLADAIAAAGIPVCPTLGRAPGASPPPQVLAVLARTGTTFEDRYRQVGQLHRAGVRLVAGLDAGINPGKPHGMSRESVIDLVTAGLSESDALVAATSAAAEACGVADTTGRLAAGMSADLLAVEGDPLADITTLRAECTVICRGRLVGPDGS